jgi:hypothetical protein
MSRVLIEPSRTYLADRFAELGTALENADGDAAVAVFARMSADGYGEKADQMVNALIVVGLTRLAAQLRD